MAKLKPICAPMMFHVLEDGNTVSANVAVCLLPSHNFSIELPRYLRTGDSTHIIKPSLAEVVAEYEAICDRYSRATLAKNSGKRMLWLGAMTQPSDFTSEVFGVQAILALGLQDVIVMPDGSVVDDDGVIKGVPGPKIVLPDSPAVREKVGRLIRSIQTASSLIEAISTAADPVACLLSIPESSVDGGNQVASTQIDPHQIELSLEVASDDKVTPMPVVEDDEL